MMDPPIDGSRSITPLKLKDIIARSLAWGVGCGLIISLVLLSTYFYIQRPKEWNSNAIRTKAVKAESLSKMNKQLAEVSSGAFFTVDLENTTADDITLPSTLTIMQGAKGTWALHGSFLKLGKEYFLPAQHLTTITLENDDLCVAKFNPQSCFDSYFKDDNQIIIFDEIRKYEIRVPIPAFTPPKDDTITFNPSQADK